MSKITLANLVNLQNETSAVNIINSNSAIIQTAMDNTLSRDGTAPNPMTASLDLNSNDILNGRTINTDDITILGGRITGLSAAISNTEPVTFAQLNAATIQHGNLPLNGASGYVLTKLSAADYDVGWAASSAPLVAGTNISITGTTTLTVATIANPNFATSVTTPSLILNGTTLNSKTGTGSIALSDSPTFTTQIISPLVIGGTAAGSSLTLESTSGSGTTDFIRALVASATESWRTVTTGQFIKGHTAAVTASAIVPAIQVHGTTASTTASGNFRWSADTSPTRMFFAKSRGASIGTNTIVQSGDQIGAIRAYGANGTDFDLASEITFEVDGTPGATTDMPGRISFWTSPDGTATSTERMRLSNAGGLTVGTPVSNTLGSILVNRNSSATLPPNFTSENAGLSIVGPNSVITRVNVYAFGTVGVLGFRTANGTLASPTATQNNDVFAAFGAVGYQTTTNAYQPNGVSMLMSATENYTSTAGGTRFTFTTTPNGSTTDVERFRIDQNGFVNIGPGVAPTYFLTVNKNTVALPSNPAGVGTQIVAGFAGADGNQCRLGLFAAGTGTYSSINYFASRGTLASPTAMQNGDFLGSNFWTAYAATQYLAGAGFVATATQNWTDSANGCKMDMYTAVNGGAARVSWTFDQDGSLKSPLPTGGLGYATGAGGTVTQATNKSTAVTLNTVTGAITMNNAALAAATIVSFTLNNTAIAATDMIVAMHESGGTLCSYTINARATGAGTASIDIRNNTAGSLSEALVIRFAVIKSVNS